MDHQAWRSMGGVMRGRWSRMCWIATLAIVCCFAGGCSHHSVQVSDRCSRASMPATASTPASTFDHLALHVPVGWYPVKVCFNTGALAFPMRYMTSEHPSAQCDPAAGGCGMPVDHLGDNEAVVAVTYAQVELSGFHPNATIAGHPAQIQSGSQHGVTSGERFDTTVLVRLRDHDAVRIAGYFGAASSTKSERPFNRCCGPRPIPAETTAHAAVRVRSHADVRADLRQRCGVNQAVSAAV